MIKRAFDTGAHGIMVPQVSKAEEAQLIVRSSKFPSRGVRGQGLDFPAIGHGLFLRLCNELTSLLMEDSSATRFGRSHSGSRYSTFMPSTDKDVSHAAIFRTIPPYY